MDLGFAVWVLERPSTVSRSALLCWFFFEGWEGRPSLTSKSMMSMEGISCCDLRFGIIGWMCRWIVGKMEVLGIMSAEGVSVRLCSDARCTLFKC